MVKECMCIVVNHIRRYATARCRVHPGLSNIHSSRRQNRVHSNDRPSIPRQRLRRHGEVGAFVAKQPSDLSLRISIASPSKQPPRLPPTPRIPLKQETPSDIIHINLTPTITLVLPKVKPNPALLIPAISIRLIDLRTLRQLPVSLQTPRLVRRVLQNHIPLFVLVVAEG